MSSAVTAATENGTSCNEVARFCAVTMISSVISSSDEACCADKANGMATNNAAAPRGIHGFMRPLLDSVVIWVRQRGRERPSPRLRTCGAKYGGIHGRWQKRKEPKLIPL